MQTGWEMSNRTDGTITDLEWERWDALPGAVAKVRPYHLVPATLEQLVLTQPPIILRPNSDGDIDVDSRVAELAHAVRLLVSWGLAPAWILVDSEPNLGGKPCPPDYWDRVWAVVEGVERETGLGWKFLSPPLAVLQGEEEWYEAGYDTIKDLDGVAVHLYGQLNTDLVHRSLDLAAQFEMTIVASEIGDSHQTAPEREKAAALAGYLEIAAQRGVVQGVIFMLGGTDDWAIFYYAPETIATYLAPVAAALAKEDAVPIPTVITPTWTPVGVPGETVTFSFSAAGIDGAANGFVSFEYPLLPGSDTTVYGPPATKEIGEFTDGTWEVLITLPPVTTPLPPEGVNGSFYVMITELNGTPQAPIIDGGKFGPFPGTVLAVPPDPPLPPDQQAAVEAARMTVFTTAGDGYNLDHDARWLTIQGLVNTMKAGG